jgi:hypothetical protein
MNNGSLHHCTSTILWKIEAARGNAATIITCIYWALRQHRRVEKIGLLLSLRLCQPKFLETGERRLARTTGSILTQLPRYCSSLVPDFLVSTTASIFRAYAYTATCSFRRSSDLGFLEPRCHDQCRAKC